MIRIEALLLKWLSNFGRVDTLRGDVSETEGRELPEEPIAPYLESPYECSPTTWGVAETPAPAPAPAAEPRPVPTPPRRAYYPSPTEAQRPESGSPGERRRRFRLNIPMNRQPPPRGLLNG